MTTTDAMKLTIRQLQAFVLIAHTRSFSRAGEQLYITQSGVSVLIRELEEQLGFRLFDRTTRHVTLNEYGARFLPAAEHSLEELQSAAASIGRLAAERRQATRRRSATLPHGGVVNRLLKDS